MKKLFTLFTFLAFFLTFTGSVLAQSSPTFYEGTVTKTGSKETVVQIKGGPLSGRDFTSDTNTALTTQKITYAKGDEVVVYFAKGGNGKEVMYIVDFVRRKQLLFLLFLFLFAVIFIGRWQGLRSLIGMGVSFLVIGYFIIPQILLGNDPVLITLLGALFMTPVIFYLGHGVSRKTTTALIGTFLALVATGLLAYLFVWVTHLTGFAQEEATYLQFVQNGGLNIKSLLLAGIIIGALGVLDDTTIAQAALVEKLRETNKRFSTGELYRHSMEVGRDHIASLVNTLVLVYAGASLPLFLLFYNSQQSFAHAVNQEIVATEIVRTLVSSIGIILAVPITTLIACTFYKD